MGTREQVGEGFGHAVRTRREALGWSLTDLAAVVRYDKSLLSRLENGRRKPTEQHARALDSALGAEGQLIHLARRALPRSPAQLPAAPARFVGRDLELAALAAAVREFGDTGGPTVVTIDGPPGAGKTALALRFAHSIAHDYPGGQLYTDLRGHSLFDPADPADVLEELLTSLGVESESVPARLEQRASLLRSALAPTRTLLVLDNASDSDQLLHLLPGAGGCAVIVTSRDRLSGLAMRTGAARVTVAPMAAAESVRLLSTIIGNRGSVDEDALGELARRCGHLPLALRIAAERVAVSELDDLVAELDDSRLDALDVADATPARTIISWSYGRLDAGSARMFRLLGLHRGPYLSVAAAAALAGVRVGAARRFLDRLAGAHLIHNPRRGHWRFHDLVADYAAELASSDPEADAAVARLASWYLHGYSSAGKVLAPYRDNPLRIAPVLPDVEPPTFGSERDAIAWCKDELPNVLPVLRLALGYGQREAAWHLPLELWSYLLLAQPWGVWIASHQLALEASRGDDYAHGWVATNLGEAYRRMGSLADAGEYYALGRELRERCGDRAGLAWSLAGSALLAIDRGEVAEARDFSEAAVELFAETDNSEGRALLLGVLGDMQDALGDHRSALAAFVEAASLMTALGSLQGVAQMLTRSAEVHVALGEHSEALADFVGATNAARQVGDLVAEVAALRSYAQLLADVGRVDEARQAWTQALTILESRGEDEDTQAAEIRAKLATHP
ncbi:ATP-binding protein [Kutzneria kofuensis]|uniref:Tetratricopeptide (TPR) repeat protein/transcriptional regulator with XRE-family HTH domain n=1 Tax=Kutzneria kofuensis TaxID=103725 RepID=A0A7W9KIN2_9PSEU|nr:tetratricopeptide repeat protein [Kutzneria kofuensis]MBB5892983.1 tetratricopeptide (TPR) repeat protein/transcriptional regulator with XRE-family HTH domain [Kutzneria kofuensis]